MADTYGAIEIPVQPPVDGAEVTDPAVSIVAGFAQVVFNTYLQAAYSAVAPAIKGLQGGTGVLARPVVRHAFTRDPAEEEFSEGDLPAVYVYRNGSDGTPLWIAENYRIEYSAWTLLWIFEPAPQAARTQLHSFVNGVVKVLDRAIESMRDPNYVTPWDTDPTARTTLPVTNALKQTAAAPSTLTTYTGAAIDGTVGAGTISPAQVPTVTASGAPWSGTVELVGVGSDGSPRVSRVVVTWNGVGPSAAFVGDFELQSLTEIDQPAAVGTTFSYGLAGYVGRGTNVLVLGGLVELEIGKWRQYPWQLAMGDGSPVRKYRHTLEVTLKVQERWVRDVNVGTSPAAVTIQYPTSGPYNDSVRETFSSS